MESENEDSPIRKRRRDSDDPEDVAGIDYISGLPEFLISHILSMLPTECAVRSSLLSRSWRHRWNLLTSFDFEYHILPLRETSMSFVKFVNMVLQKTAAGSINMFRLRRETHKLGAITVNRWISTALARNCRVLDLDISFPGNLPLDPGEDVESDNWLEFHPTGAIYSCATLEVLRLRGCFYLEMPDYVCLPKLAVLELFNVLYQRRGALCELLAGCPVIESLTVERRDFDCMVVCSICSPTLKRLRIHLNDDFDVEEEEGVVHVLKLEIDAPALEYLYLHDIVTSCFSMKGLTSVTEMDLNVSPRATVKDGGAIAELVRAFDQVKFLKFSSEALIGLLRATKKLSSTSFGRVTKLVVDFDSFQWSQSMDLIDRCIKLEVLEIGCLDVHSPYWRGPIHVPRCLLSSLKQVTFRPFDGLEDEMSMLKVFLDHGLVLETVNLCPFFGYKPEDYKKRFHMLNKVSKLPRASPSCKISACGWFEDMEAVEWDEEQ